MKLNLLGTTGNSLNNSVKSDISRDVCNTNFVEIAELTQKNQDIFIQKKLTDNSRYLDKSISSDEEDYTHEIEKLIQSIIMSMFSTNNCAELSQIDNAAENSLEYTREIYNILKEKIENINIVEDTPIKGIIEEVKKDLTLRSELRNRQYQNLYNSLSSNLEGTSILDSKEISGRIVNLEGLISESYLKTPLNTKSKDEEDDILRNILRDNTSSNNININLNSQHLEINNSYSDGYIDENIPTEIREEFMAKDIIKTIDYLKDNNLQSIKVKLTPEELGDITVEFVKGAKDSKILITISKDDIFQMVNNNLEEINKHLGNLDIKVNEVIVDINNENKNSSLDNFQQEFARRQSESNANSKKNRKIEIVEDECVDTITNENINLLA